MAIALLDKEQLLLNTLADALRKARLSTDIRIFTNAASFLQQKQSRQINIIVTDLILPDRSGTDLLYALKKFSPDSKLIILSSITDTFSIRLAMRDGVQGYLSKQISLDELIMAITAVGKGDLYIEENLRTKLVRYAVVEDKYLYRLSGREKEVLRLVCEGKTIKEAAHVLKLSTNTIQTYYRSILRKFDMKKTSELIVFAIQNGLYSPQA